MLGLLPLLALATASPVVVPHHPLLRQIYYPYYPAYPFVHRRVVTEDCPKENLLACIKSCPVYPSVETAPCVHGCEIRCPALPLGTLVLDINIDYTCTKEGVFINPEDCGSYFVCNDNGAGLKAAKVKCAGVNAGVNHVLAFNNATGQCDWAHNVPGCQAWGRLNTSPVVVDPFFDYTCEEEGIFYNPEDCASYVTCNAKAEGGIKAAKVNCPLGLLFNVEWKVCDWPVNVPDCAARKVATNPQPSPQPIVACNDDPTVGRIIGVNVPCTEPIIACQDGTFRIDCDPVSDAWWWTIEETDPKIFDCTGKAVGAYEHPDQCNMYFVCSSDHRAFRHTCSEGTLFSLITGECMFEEEVQCGGRQERV